MAFTDPPEISDERCWDLTSYFVRAKNGARYAGLLHLPANSASREDPEPLCAQSLTSTDAEWVVKRTEVYPPGFRSICENCRRKIAYRL